MIPQQKHYISIYAAGKFGAEKEGKSMVIQSALCGFKSSGAAYRVHFAVTLIVSRSKASKADPDGWLPEATKAI
jgi:hypothetical protein